MEALLNKLKANNLIDDMGNIILEKYENGSYQSVDIETFNSFFGGTTCTYTSLKAADQGKGYTRFFDQWKAKGIL
jgi:hypothetical protein